MFYLFFCYNYFGDYMKNIIFDLGGVIVKGKPISVLNDLDKNTYDELKIFFDDWDDLDLGNITLLDKYNMCNFSSDLYKKRLTKYYLYRDFNFDLVNLISLLKLKKYNVYILSDNNFEVYNFYRNNELFKDIDGWVVSCSYNTLKRDGFLFKIFLDKFNLNPSECYFIDDNIVNINKAFEYGIKGYVFDNYNLLCDDMRNNGIDI